MKKHRGELILAAIVFGGAAIVLLIGPSIDMNRSTVELIQGVIAAAGGLAVYWLAQRLRKREAEAAPAEEEEKPRKRRSKRESKAAGAGGTLRETLAALDGPELRAALVVLAIVSAASFLRFGHYHHPRFLHNWDLYHYFLGARYFDELGYYDLYRCTLEADAELDGEMSEVTRVRDLRTLGYTTRSRILRQDPPCRDNFTPARWESFKQDLRLFHELTPQRLWRLILRDKGYNGTPTWTWYVGLLTEWSGSDEGRLTLLCWLDQVLLVAALIGVLFTFGPRAFLISTLFVGINFATRFQHLGGSLLRLDWLAALVGALCLLKRERWAAAGVLVGFGTMARLFPLVFVAGLGFRAIWTLIDEKRLERRYLRFGAGLAAAIVALGLLGAANPSGFDAWREFAANIGPHASAPATKRIGLKYVILPIGGEVEPDRASGQTANQALRERWSRRQPLALVIAAGALFLMFLGSRRQEDFEAFALGVIPLFFLLAPTRYYWTVLFVPVAIWAMMRRRWEVEALVMLFAMQAMLYFLNNATRLGLSDDRTDNATLSSVSSWCLLLVFGYVLWCVSRDDLKRWWGKNKAEESGGGVQK